MTNIEQGLRRLSKHRYSIQHLLALSGAPCPHFDLSKFSFDAARAGVIPSLGDCAISSRKSSITNAHASSSDSANTVEDSMVSLAKEAQVLQRRPQPPPAGDLPQQHTGFARFLKKHSSPTHQRVTAGGRIVPMEAKRPPPTFQLTKPEKSDTTELFHTVVEQKPQTRKLSAGMGQKRLEKMSESETHILHVMPSVERTENTLYGLNMFSSTEWSIPLVNTSYPTMAQHGSMANMCSPLTGIESVSTPVTGYVPNNNTPYSLWPNSGATSNATIYPAMCSWQFHDSMSNLTIHPQTTYSSPLSSSIVWAQDALSDWTQRYNDLDQQLKMLDRHRAMTSLTPDLAQQRREIVQQRSDSKNMMNQITSWLNMSEQVHPEIDTQSSTLIFNVDAVPYIPTAQNTYSAVPIRAGVEVGTTSNVGGTKLPIRPTRRPIAIVPPPKSPMNASCAQKCGSPPISPSPEDVDSWGVKIGSAPPELRKQQIEILQTLSEVQDQSLCSSHSQESLQPVPQGGYFQQQAFGSERRDSFGCTANQHEVMHAMPAHNQTEIGTLGAQEESELPVNRFGQASVLHFAEDYCFSSSTPYMHMREQQSHDTKAQRRALTTPVSRGSSANRQDLSGSHDRSMRSGKENISVTPTAHRKAATELFLARFNVSESYAEMPSYQETRSLEIRHKDEQLPSEGCFEPRGQRFGVDEVTHRNGRTLQHDVVNRSDAFATDLKSEHSRMTDQNMSGRSWNMSMDTCNKKGYSSTSVQSVHAIAQLPQNLDGAGDNVRVSRSIFSLVGKGKSPRILYRNTGNGAKRLGPDCREVLERTLIYDNGGSPRGSPKRATAP